MGMGGGMSQKLLIVEDEADLAEPMRVGLADEGYHVEIALTGQAAMRRLEDYWDLIILDLMLPDMPGESILNYLKQQPDYPAILILTARGTLQDKLSLFRQGCDDYLTKPFIFEELVERVRALLRRSQRVNAPQCSYEDISLDPTSFRLTAGDEQVILTPKETSILRLLMTPPERIVSRKEILHGVWGLKEEPETNFIGVHLFKLRKKLAEVSREEWLKTVRNAGFMLARPETGVHGS
jgi:DNA-binding response OmpR family regulator